MHRDALSHPWLPREGWWSEEGRRFYDERRVWVELRAGLVWVMQLSLNECLRSHGKRPTVEAIDVSPAMALALHAILRCTFTAESLANVPDEATVLESLKTFRGRFMDSIQARASADDEGG
jgi:hypothetical protein